MTILIGLAVLLNVLAAFRPNPEIDLGPIDLTPGTTVRAAFEPGYAETYAIGVRMDRRVAERLYPCTVSLEAMEKPYCKNRASSWPVVLSSRISAEGHDLTNEIWPGASLAGGEYDGANTYTWESALVRLVPGRTYHLSVRSIGRASLLGSARPHLVVSAAGAPGLLESLAIEQIAALFVGVLLIAGAAVWATISVRRRKPATA
jgi:hypothetical protein